MFKCNDSLYQLQAKDVKKDEDGILSQAAWEGFLSNVVIDISKLLFTIVPLGVKMLWFQTSPKTQMLQYRRQEIMPKHHLWPCMSSDPPSPLLK